MNVGKNLGTCLRISFMILQDVLIRFLISLCIFSKLISPGDLRHSWESWTSLKFCKGDCIWLKYLFWTATRKVLEESAVRRAPHSPLSVSCPRGIPCILFLSHTRNTAIGQPHSGLGNSSAAARPPHKWMKPPAGIHDQREGCQTPKTRLGELNGIKRDKW